MVIKRKSKPDILQQILDKLTSIEARLTNVESRLTNVESRLTILEKRVEEDHNLLIRVIKLNNLRTK